MANAKKCDRCGTYFEEKPSEEKKIVITRHDKITGFDLSQGVHFKDVKKEEIDLCPDCMEELLEFLRGKKDE